ncbi:hypothetical protein KO527_05280 [Pseudoalteromonas sp. C2R02]|uniref:hypothetical protein n=1 Tax=Pseudoalteromonas sp. C2R02 TaxID=2841565 RepID=UPI001C08F15D|nr:hypothetical protein [Pseudoalteromonas sp. C2R02]MBU2968760.1 hypothetical protein [Pseudoalteromonas sp. C2R02]
MKRSTATKHLNTIIERLKENNGMFYTPDCDRPMVVVFDAWVFGSYAKGSDQPNDLDILFSSKKFGEFNAEASLEGKRAYDRAVINIRKGMKMIRVHDIGIDGNYGDIAETKQLIFSRNNS